jgi:hypothetical protein
MKQEEIDKLWYKAMSQAMQQGELYTRYKFAELIVRETINEMIGQLWNYGIDESNNPSFYKAVERTKEHFGVEE